MRVEAPEIRRENFFTLRVAIVLVYDTGIYSIIGILQVHGLQQSIKYNYVAIIISIFHRARL